MVFITGASSGIGEACAQLYAQKGVPLWLVARRLNRLEKIKTKLTKEHGGKITISHLDITSKSAVAQFFDSQAKALSQVTILVNNAGLTLGLDPIQNGNTEDWDTIIDTNVKGLLYITRGFLPLFIKSGKGHIVNLGSVASRWTYPKGNVYCASKRAVSSLTEGLRLDLHGTGIRVTEISPGLVKTEFSLVRFKGDRERARSVYEGVNCLTAEDIAEAIVWATERPSHVNIQEMVLYPVDQASTNHLIRKPGEKLPPTK